MNVRKTLATGAVALAIFGAGFGLAQAPTPDINARKHPNLAEAQRLLDQAFHKISDAQKANEFDMDGHAAKAKDLIDQASRELKTAAQIAGRK